MLDRKGIVATLNSLIQAVEDSHESFRQAAEGVAEPDLKALFNDTGAQRGAIARELQRLVAEQGGAPDAGGGTVLGGAQRAIQGLKAAVLGSDRAAILAALRRAERDCLTRFEEALAGELPQPVKAVLAQHRDRLRADEVRLAGLPGQAA